jgi:uncharacterized alpha-E superfamily protein
MSLLQDVQFRPTVPTLESPRAGRDRPVLARDADSTYWMARYVERAEHIARLLLVNGEVLIDVGDLSIALLHRHWQSVLQIMHAEQLPPGDAPLLQRIASYMTFDESNPNSLISCLTRARENARGIREVISSEMWEHLNTLYWSIRSNETATSFAEAPDLLFDQIISGSMLFQGLTDQTLGHDQRWFFAQLGKYFERISVTCRILRNKHEILREAETEADTPLWNLHWIAVLRSCGSLETYRRSYVGELDPLHVAQFLILEDDLPRSVRYCVHEAHQAIAAIRALVRPRQLDPTERILGRLDAQLEYAESVELAGDRLPRYLGDILDNIAEAALSIQRSFFMH